MRNTAFASGFQVILSAACARGTRTKSNPAHPTVSFLARISPTLPICYSAPIHGQLARIHNYILLLSREFHQVHKKLDVVFAILTSFLPVAFTPPPNDLQPVPCLH